MLHFRATAGSPAYPGIHRPAVKKPLTSIPTQAPTAPQAEATAPLQRQHFSGQLLQLARPGRVQFSGEILKQQNIPVVDMRDFNSADPVKKSQFVQKLGKSLADYGFVAIAGHGVPQELINRHFRALESVFALPMNAKKQYVRADLGRNRGYYELGQEKKAAEVGGEKKYADLNEKWHSGAVANVFPTEQEREVPIFKDANPALYNSMEKTGIQIIEAIGLYLDSIGMKDNGYLKSTVVNQQDNRPIGSHLLRSIHYPPVTPQEQQRYQAGQPVIRAGEHYDLNLITLLPEATESGLQILRRKAGQEDKWLPIHSQEGHLICNAGDMLSFITGGTTNAKGTIDQSGVLPSIRHRVVGDPGSLNKPRYSTPFFLTPHYDKPLKNLKTGESLPTGEFVYRRLKGHGSLDPSIGYPQFRQNVGPMLLKT